MDSDLQNLLIQKIINDKEKSGELQLIISKSIDNMITDICSELLAKDGEIYKNTKNKLSDCFSNAIDTSDLSVVINKFNKVIHTTLPNTSLNILDTVCDNIYNIFGRKITEEIDIKDIFAEYCKFIEKQFNINKDDIYDYDIITADNTCTLKANAKIYKYTNNATLRLNTECSGYIYTSAFSSIDIECNLHRIEGYENKYTIEVLNKKCADIMTANSFLLYLIILENNNVIIRLNDIIDSNINLLSENVSCKIYSEK